MGPQVFAVVDVNGLAEWIQSIPFEDWPQQHRLNGEIRPAMVTDLAWQGFGDRTESLVQALASETFGRMLSVVMPGHWIDPHVDVIDGALTRVHVPILTNDRAFMVVDGVSYGMSPGLAYTLDTRAVHSVKNYGDTPRIHLMFDVRAWT